MGEQGVLYTISGPSGVGKSSLVAALAQKISGLRISVSHTTRPARSSEEDGTHYHFVSMEVFEDMLRREVFLEHAQVFGHCYGSSREWVEQTLARGEDVILEIDWQGAQQVRERMPQSVGIFLLPPGEDDLRQRLGTRGHDPELISTRLECATREMQHLHEADYLVINRNFDRALSDLCCIVLSNRLRCAYSSRTNQELIEELIGDS